MTLRKLFIFFVCLFPAIGFSQESMVYASENYLLKKGFELYEKELFGAAQRQFSKIMKDGNFENTEVLSTATYYHALCAMSLFNRDADFLLREFIRIYPESPLIQKAYFQLGKYNYRQNQWKRCIEYFEKVDVFELSATDKHEYNFFLAYAYFNSKDFENAKKYFFEIKDSDNAYYAPANYYYAHINYKEANYETALKGFEKLKEDEQFQAVVPYYIAQILYKQGKYQSLTAYGPDHYEQISSKRKAEFARLIGDAFYELKDYENALPFLEEYAEKDKNLDKNSRYQLGYTYFKLEKYEQAQKMFSGLSRFEDEIAQASLYHLGECYLKNNEKAFARNAFYEAFKLGFDDNINKDALFKFAVLSYELQYDPYSSAIKAFTDFIQKYPNAEEADIAYTYLINLYLTSKNYDKALESIEKIGSLDFRLKEAYQLIAFNKASKLFTNEDYLGSLDYFDKSLKYPVSEELNALTLYWKAEAFYALNDFQKASKNFEAFLFTPRAILTPFYHSAHYNLGYTFLNQKDYSNASKWFRKYLTFKTNNDSLKINDALNRAGDCFFITKRYFDAVDFYNQSIEMAKLDRDYALFQAATAYGIVKNRDQKIALLKVLVAEHTDSQFSDAANYELGRSYVLKNDELLALEYFGKVIENTPQSLYVKKSLVNSGMIYYNQRENDKALQLFKRVVADYPTFEDTREALSGIRNIYVELGKIDEYELYINQLSFIDIGRSTLDSTTYESAELRYMDEDYASAIEAFTKYLKKFKPANFELNAIYYRANAHLSLGQKSLALSDFLQIIERPYNKFTQTALTNAADIAFQLDSSALAITLYSQLEKNSNNSDLIDLAHYRLLGLHYQANNDSAVIYYANKVLTKEKLSTRDWLKAKFFIGKSFYQKDSLDSAYVYFDIVADTSTTEMSAEANFIKAEILFKKQELAEAEQEVFKLVNRVPSYDYWIAKGLILLSDIYVLQNDLFQAKATLKSIIANYEGDELRNLALDKISEIEALESPEEAPVQQENIEIDLREENGGNTEIFEPDNLNPDDDE